MAARMSLHTANPDLWEATVMGNGIPTATAVHAVRHITDKCDKCHVSW